MNRLHNGAVGQESILAFPMVVRHGYWGCVVDLGYVPDEEGLRWVALCDYCDTEIPAGEGLLQLSPVRRTKAMWAQREKPTSIGFWVAGELAANLIPCGQVDLPGFRGLGENGQIDSTECSWEDQRLWELDLAWERDWLSAEEYQRERETILKGIYQRSYRAGSRSGSEVPAMKEHVFWGLIKRWKEYESGDNYISEVVRRLCNLDCSEIVSFHYMLAAKLWKLDDPRVARDWALAGPVRSTKVFPVDSFLYSRLAAIARGKVFYEDVTCGKQPLPSASLEGLIYASSGALKVKGCADDWSTLLSESMDFETFANSEAWQRGD